MRVWRRLAAGVVTVALGATAVGCGDEDFPNDPRPPAPIQITANVTDQRVIVSPDEIGAGPMTLVASNQSQDEATVTLDGPTPVQGQPIPPGGVGQLKAILKQGNYEVSGGEESGAAPGKLIVGPERPTSSNDLLLP